MEVRLPAALEVAGMLRLTSAIGGFGMILHKGDPDAGTILVVALDRENLGTVYERLPDPNGPRRWTAVRQQDSADRAAFETYLARRREQDRDLWIVELTVADVERSILNAG